MSAALDLRLSSSAITAGEPVEGEVVVLEGGAVRSLTAHLGFCESTPAYARVAATLPPAVLCEGRDLRRGEVFRFAIALPADALPTVRSPSGETRLYWQLDLWLERVGPDVHETREIEVRTAPRPEA